MLHDEETNTISLITEFADGSNLMRKLYEY